MTAALTGFSLFLSLIFAVGPQNAFVLQQGIRREHVLATVLACAVSDTILIFAGIASFGVIVTQAPLVEPLLRYGGATFLIYYGWTKAWSALFRREVLSLSETAPQPLGQTLLTCLTITWLNPSAYLETVVLLGAAAPQTDSSLMFGVGATAASFIFFFFLGFGARLLTQLFRNPNTWRFLDAGLTPRGGPTVALDLAG
ncbi:L-lysine exporter, putative [Parvularcula bermudensis HTCC2503]|uniref:L-lysine exporter, putative n=1 Tax=Parvularcula bermudensis (strain ATCC BAA-594 / HTCC2503 / KCTC 12087) TaxID=314260 RepID=E0THJ3_PARBH|nr:LysE family transporter [Parvularcula bermudensis]ADM09289.1 L-lysine exporter, putative [Parvularcula bermudensis HTCC2503]